MEADIWTARYRAELTAQPVSEPPQAKDPAWMPMRQHWRETGPEAALQPGWARVEWNEGFLRYDVVLAGRGPRNSARTLNEPTWTLGDVCEIFFQSPRGGPYIELHVTPENRRLQLRWTPEGFRAFRQAGATDISPFLVTDPQWVTATTQIAPNHWSVSALVPVQALPIGPAALRSGGEFLTAVCRYDCSAGPETVFSSTASLTQLSYHRWEDWNRLRLIPA